MDENKMYAFSFSFHERNNIFSSGSWKRDQIASALSLWCASKQHWPKIFMNVDNCDI